MIINIIFLSRIDYVKRQCFRCFVLPEYSDRSPREHFGATNFYKELHNFDYETRNLRTMFRLNSGQSASQFWRTL